MNMVDKVLLGNHNTPSENEPEEKSRESSELGCHGIA